MKLKGFLWVSEVLTSLFWVIFFLILIFIDPYKASAAIFTLFFFSLLMALIGTWGLLEFRITTRIKGMEGMNQKIFTAFRHGVMISLIISGLLFMKGIQVLTLWDGIIFILAIILFEAYFLTRGNIIQSQDSRN